MNRKERRAERKATPAYLRVSPEEREKMMMRNGISERDLEREYNRGHKDGFREATQPTIMTCFAAVCLALEEGHGFKAKRCADVLNATYGHMMETLTSKEAIDEVYKRMGLELDFKEPFDPVREV